MRRNPYAVAERIISHNTVNEKVHSEVAIALIHVLQSLDSLPETSCFWREVYQIVADYYQGMLEKLDNLEWKA